MTKTGACILSRCATCVARMQIQRYGGILIAVWLRVERKRFRSTTRLSPRVTLLSKLSCFHNPELFEALPRNFEGSSIPPEDLVLPTKTKLNLD
jgi:hypothetical protein